MKQILLTQGKVALVDDEDYDALMQHKWYAEKSTKTFYACTHLKAGDPVMRMHNMVTGKKGIDHWDNDGLNNQKSNLREAGKSQNGRNKGKILVKNASSIYKGVTRNNKNGSWGARVTFGGKCIYLGTRKLEEDAAKLYDEFALKHFGEFARLNFPCKP